MPPQLAGRFHGAGSTNPRRTIIAGSPVTIHWHTSYSNPDPVTGNVLKLQDQEYLFSKHGRTAILFLWAPTGADVLGPWKKIAESFRWR